MNGERRSKQVEIGMAAAVVQARKRVLLITMRRGSPEGWHKRTVEHSDIPSR